METLWATMILTSRLPTAAIRYGLELIRTITGQRGVRRKVMGYWYHSNRHMLDCDAVLFWITGGDCLIYLHVFVIHLCLHPIPLIGLSHIMRRNCSQMPTSHLPISDESVCQKCHRLHARPVYCFRLRWMGRCRMSPPVSAFGLPRSAAGRSPRPALRRGGRSGPPPSVPLCRRPERNGAPGAPPAARPHLEPLLLPPYPQLIQSHLAD